jgi:tetratricopeptide (TPR) repeat protein
LLASSSWGLVALLALGFPALGFFFWWRGRPLRHLAEARRLIEAGRTDEASGWLDLPETEPGTRDRALLLRVRAAVERGRPSEAVKPLEQIDPNGPLTADIALWKGRTLFQVRQVSRAVHWLREALTLRPDDPETIRWLAAALYELGDHPSTVAALTRLTQLERHDAKAWRTLALLNKENRDFEPARIAYEQALWLDPNQPLVRFELAETLLELGQHEGAEQQLAACRGGVPEPDRRALLLHCRLQASGDTERFRDLLDVSLREFPDHPGLLSYRARVDLTEGRIAEALDGFNRVLAANPFHAQAFYQRGLANRRLGKSSEAMRDLARAAELNNLVAEMDRLNREAGKNPDDPEIRSQLGRICVVVGKPELAASWYVAALACDPHHPGAKFGLKALGREDLIRHPTRNLRPGSSRSEPG